MYNTALLWPACLIYLYRYYIYNRQPWPLSCIDNVQHCPTMVCLSLSWTDTCTPLSYHGLPPYLLVQIHVHHCPTMVCCLIYLYRYMYNIALPQSAALSTCIDTCTPLPYHGLNTCTTLPYHDLLPYLLVQIHVQHCHTMVCCLIYCIHTCTTLPYHGLNTCTTLPYHGLLPYLLVQVHVQHCPIVVCWSLTCIGACTTLPYCGLLVFILYRCMYNTALLWSVGIYLVQIHVYHCLYMFCLKGQLASCISSYFIQFSL